MSNAEILDRIGAIEKFLERVLGGGAKVVEQLEPDWSKLDKFGVGLAGKFLSPDTLKALGIALDAFDGSTPYVVVSGSTTDHGVTIELTLQLVQRQMV